MLPSRWETANNVSLEAASCGTLVLGTNISGLRESVLSMETGILVPISVDAITQKILEIKDYTSRFKHLIYKARRHIQNNYALDYVIDKLDLILIMSVNPGFGGQKFIPESLPKIKAARKLIAKRDIMLAVDGGVNLDTIKQVAKAGADTIIMGSAIFKTKDYRETIGKIRSALS